MADDSHRLTPLGVVVLALLREGDMHPYEMMRLLRQRREDRLVAITNGTFYHTVGRLLQAGLITEIGVDRDGNRPERTTYSLTERGAEVTTDWVRRELGTTDRPDTFRVALAEAHNLPREEVHHLLERRREALRAERDVHQSALAQAWERRVPGQYLIESDRHLAMLTAELDWLERTVATITDPDFGWGVDDQTTPRHETPPRKADRP